MSDERVEEVLFEAKGISFDGRRPPSEIFAELKRQQESAKDYVLNTKHVSFSVNKQAQLQVCLQRSFVEEEGKPKVEDIDVCVPLNRRCHAQVAEFVGLPMKSPLYSKFTSGTKRDSLAYFETWAALYNDMLHIEPTVHQFRVMSKTDGSKYLRAFLSSHYRNIDNVDVFLSLIDTFDALKVDIMHARLDDDYFHLYAVAPGISAQISPERVFAAGDGRKVRWSGEANDVVNAALSISNSETGAGACTVRPAIFRQVSGSYAVFDTGLTKRHIGTHETGDDVMLSKETRKKKDAAFFAELQDWVKGTFTPEILEKYIQTVKDSTLDEVEDPVAAAEGLRVTYDISEARKEAIMRRFLQSGDRSRYGLAQAVLDESVGQLAPREGTLLEQVGARIMSESTSAMLVRAGQSATAERLPKRRKARFSAARAAQEAVLV